MNTMIDTRATSTPDGDALKRCSSCKQRLPLTSFGKNRTCKDGLHHSCRSCASEAFARWRRKNPEKAREAKARWRRENPEKVREAKARRRRENPEKVRAENALPISRARRMWSGACREARRLGAHIVHTDRDAFIIRATEAITAFDSIGIKVECDHRIPMTRGGEHSLRNTQFIPEAEHRAKTRRDLLLPRAVAVHMGEPEVDLSDAVTVTIPLDTPLAAMAELRGYAKAKLDGTEADTNVVPMVGRR